MADEEQRKFWETVQGLISAKHSMVLQGVPAAVLDAIFQGHVQLDTFWQCPSCVALNRANEMVCDGEEYTCSACGTVVVAHVERWEKMRQRESRIDRVLKLCDIQEQRQGRIDSKGTLAAIPVAVVRDQLGENPFPGAGDPEPVEATHEQLVAIYRKLPTDYEPYGERSNDERGGDCSCSCKWFHELGRPSCDWGVCFNPDSPRAGLLTFEHQGCPAFEYEPDDDEEDDDE